MKVLITSATRNAGMAITRALGQNGVEVIGSDDRLFPPGLCSRFAERYYLYPNSEKKGFVSAIIEILKKEKPDVILALGGSNLVSKYKAKIEEFTNCLVPDYESFKKGFDNRTTLEECEQLGVLCPKILTESEAINELNRQSDGANPARVVIKPRREIGGGIGVHFVKDLEALRKAKEEIELNYGESVIQEFIPGDTTCMRTINLMFDNKSNLAAYFTTKKIREWPTTGGTSALSISTNEKHLVDNVLPLLEKWRWRGPAEVEFKIDSRDNKPKLIEINPRFWGYIGFPIRCGVNFPLIACKLALGSDNHYSMSTNYPVGIKYINPLAYLKAVKAEIWDSKNKPDSLRRIVSDLRGKKVTNNVQLRDLLSIIGKVLLELKPAKPSYYWHITDK